MPEEGMELEEIYHSSSVNRTPKCLAWKGGDTFLYGSSNDIVRGRMNAEKQCLEFVSVLRGGHGGRVNCIQWVDESSFISGSSDGAVVLWTDMSPSLVLKNHSKSVISVSGLRVNPKGLLLVASASGDSTLSVSSICEKDSKLLQTFDFGTGYALDVKLGAIFFEGKPHPILLYSRDDSRVYLHAWSGESFAQTPSHVFRGHEDWVQGMDLFSDKKSFNLLATSGQDCYIRVWKIGPKSVDSKDDEDVIKMEEVVMRVPDGPEFLISLETLLYGHEDKVYQIQWDERSKDRPLLLSCSMDKTMIIWEAPGDVDDVWSEKVRVGETGGNTLGFLGCQISPGGTHVLGYSFNGALHFWYEEDDRWSPGVTIGGHFGSVEDIGWAQDGSYLLSVSSDQTTRIHAPWSTGGSTTWHEVARPNVHGHDLSCISVLPDHRYVLGAEEKVIRAFQATRNFLLNLSLIGKQEAPSELARFAQGASVPSLGLSNKAVFEGSLKAEAQDEKHVKDQFPEFYFVDSSYSDPPPEETLIQNTLWPEVRKLYGHVYEVFRLASSPSGRIVASASKAAQKEHASIILWDTRDWSLKERLTHHGLTVTAMDFSPCEQYFLSGSRDRSWALYEKGPNGFYAPISSPSVKGKGYPHSRLIWAVGFSPDSKLFFTASRDKKVALWRVLSEEKAVELVSVCPMEDAVTAGVFLQSSSKESYSLAVGLENGKISVLTLRNNEFSIGSTIHPHGKAVKKIAKNCKGLLASCSLDHSVKVYKVKL